MTVEEFKKLIEENGFVEWARFGGNYYGTSVQAVRDLVEAGKVPVLDIEMEVGFSPLPHSSLHISISTKCTTLQANFQSYSTMLTCLRTPGSQTNLHPSLPASSHPTLPLPLPAGYGDPRAAASLPSYR